VSSLARQGRRTDRRNLRVGQVLNELRRGCALHHTYSRNGGSWALSDGRRVDDAIARLVIQDARVVGDSDGMRPGLSQIYRWVEP
jgi:hypothetical protein